MDQNPIIVSFIQSGPFGKTILFFLLFLSIYIWTIIQSKYFLFKNIRKKSSLFLREFRKSGGNIFQPIKNEQWFTGVPVFEVFTCAKKELVSIMDEERGIDSIDVEHIGNMMAGIISKTREDLNKGDLGLATATTIAPFLGLLGTVWGVMNAFVGMGEVGNASIAAVAPGLSESLVTTAVGLIVAIPAAVAFNYARGKTQKEVIVLNNFSLEILISIEKKFLTKEKRN